MGRWKDGGDGNPYYDPNDDGPNQVAVPQGYNANGTQQQTPSGTETQPQQQNPFPTAESGSTGQFNYDPSQMMYPGGSATFDEGFGGSGQPIDANILPWKGVGYVYRPGGSDALGTGGGIDLGPYAHDWTPRNPDGSIIDFGSLIQQGGTTPQQPSQPPQYQFMEGVDTNKLNDPNHQSAKYTAARILASGGTLADAAASVGGKVIDDERFTYPDPNTGQWVTIDTRRDHTGANGQPGADALQWLVLGDGGTGAGAPPPPGMDFNALTGGFGGSGAGGFGSFPGAGGFSSGSFSGLLPGPGTGAAYGGAPFGALLPFGSRGDSLYDLLGQRATQSLIPSAHDPVIANQVDSYRAEQQRGVRDQLAAAAEAQGPNANLNQERRMAYEKAAQSTGGLQAQLIQNEMNARRQEIAQALAQMGNLLTDEQKMALQRELSYLDAGLQQQRITNQNNQFLDQFGLDVTDRANYWDALRSGLLG